jgi:hypothetical protein
MDSALSRRESGVDEISNPTPDSAQSIDDKLNALVESIRAWDWRSADVAQAQASQGRHVRKPSFAQDQSDVAGMPWRARDISSKSDNPPIFIRDGDGRTDPIAEGLAHPTSTNSCSDSPVTDWSRYGSQGQPNPDLITFRPLVPLEHPEAASGYPDERVRLGGDAGWASPRWDDAAVSYSQGGGAADSGASRPIAARSRRRLTKVLPWLIVAVVVIAVVTAIRLSVPSQDAGSLSPTTVTSKGSGATIPISSTARSEFTTASKLLDASNVTFTQALASSSAPTVAQITQDVTPYLAVPSKDLTLRTQELITFLGSLTSVTPATQDSWLTQLHALATTAQSADNLVRKDIGLTLTTSYPT